MNETTSVIVPAERMARRDVARPISATDVTSPLQLLALAVQQGQSVEQMQQLLALQERWEANQARKAFDAAIAEAKAQIKPIAKRQEVDFTSQKGRTHYKYEGLGDIAEEVDPILAKHGLSYRHRSLQDGKRLKITCVLSHRDGHCEETSLVADNDESGNKNSIQAIGSTATFLQRYTLKLALGLSTTKDDDGRGSDDKLATISESQLADLKALIEETGSNLPRLLAYFKLPRLEDLPAKNFEVTCQDIRRIANSRKPRP